MISTKIFVITFGNEIDPNSKQNRNTNLKTQTNVATTKKNADGVV